MIKGADERREEVIIAFANVSTNIYIYSQRKEEEEEESSLESYQG